MEKINRKTMIDSLNDAVEQINYLIHGLNNFPEIDQAQFEEEIKTAYQHLNLAINARHLTETKFMDLCYEEDKFQEWGNYPDDIDLHIVDKKMEF